MYCLSDKQIEYIINDISARGVDMVSLQQNLLDHICCIVEENLEENGDFETFYQKTIKTFYKNDLKEIEEETKLLLTFKNYYKMKKVMIVSGTLGVSAFVFGSFFKIMHWPGAAVILTSAIVIISFLFLPLLFILKVREKDNTRNKIVMGVGTLVGILYCLSTWFKVMHWPYANIMWLIGIGIASLLFIPLFFFSGIRNPETKVNTIVSTILLVVAVGNLFMLTNLRPANPTKVFAFIQSELLLDRMDKKLLASRGGENNYEKDLLSIQENCKAIKALILQNEIGHPTLPKNFDATNTVINEASLPREFYEDGRGANLLIQLKENVSQYNISHPLDKIPVKNSVLDMDFNRMDLYTNIFVLNNVTQVQLFLANVSREKEIASLK